MIEKPRMVRPETRLAKKKSKEHSTSQFQGQPSLWSQDQSTPDTGHVDRLEATSDKAPRRNAAPREDHALRTREKQTIQDLLLPEGLLGVKLSVEATTLDDLQTKLMASLRQNSVETRTRYAQSVVRWFFPDGLDGLAQKVWIAYHDDPIECDVLRYLYLYSEPIVGACVAEALFPLQEGIVIPSNYFDRFLNEHLGTQPSPKTRKRLKMNLVKLGFLKPLRPESHRLNPVTPTKTAFLVLLHYLFAPVEPRTIELRNLFTNPFWKYLGFKSEDAVRSVIREANALGFLGKYIVADQLEQITTCLTLTEMLKKGVRI
jgi:hypothetical protein